MALGPRLDLRQSQSLVMTPQLQQAIKLLALSNLEIESFIGDALESNPLLEAGEVRREETGLPDAAHEEPGADTAMDRAMDGAMDGGGGAEAALDLDPAALDHDRDTGDGERSDGGEWGAAAGSAGDEDWQDIGERTGDGPTLAQHLEAQIGLAVADAREEFLVRFLVNQLNEAGYVEGDMRELAFGLGVAIDELVRALGVVQTFDPPGVGARDLAECIALQARAADRYDPAMKRLIDNLDLVARGEFARLKRMCDVDDEDFADMLAELRGYDPKPGLAFGAAAGTAIVPDILVTRAKHGGWDIALNEASMPRLVVNRSYLVTLREGCRDKASRNWLGEKLADANWLIKALDQRARTILKVAAEIVKLQDGFFRKGVSELRPLTLARVAEAIEMHESTVSRVTSSKYLHCDRGTFELKYFFTSGVGSMDSEGASSAAVKARIRALIDAENPKAILSDDTLVEMLKGEGFDLARRTVAKYREAMGIGSSVQRRRQKKLAAGG